MPWTVATQPDLDPSALESLKSQVRESSNVFDDELTRVLAEAVDIIQSVTHRQLINATAVFTRERFPVGSAKLVLPPSPLVSVTSVAYTDGDDAGQTWSDTLYDVTTNTEPGYLRPVFNGNYPSDARSRSDVIVTYVTGFGISWSTVDARIQRAVILQAQMFYEPDKADTDLLKQSIDHAMVGDELCGQTA